MAVRKAVNSEINSKNYVPFVVTPEAPFNLACIEEMKMTWQTKDDVKTPALNILFTNGTGERHLSHYENEIGGAIGNLSEDLRIKAQDAHFAHMYDAFMGDGAYKTAGPKAHINGTLVETPIGTVVKKLPKVEGQVEDVYKVVEEAEYHKFFESILNSFMTGRGGKPIFLDTKGEPIIFWLKQVYSPKGQLQVPLFNNFIDIYEEGKECLLNIDPMHDLVRKPEIAQNITNAAINITNAAAGKGAPKGFGKMPF